MNSTNETNKPEGDSNVVLGCLVLGLIIDAFVIYAWWTGEYRGRLSIISLMFYPIVFVMIGTWIESKVKK